LTITTNLCYNVYMQTDYSMNTKQDLLDLPLKPARVDAVSTYVDEYLSKKETRWLATHGLVYTTNGITKCMAAWHAVAKYCPWHTTDSTVCLVSVGEGAKPTVSAMFSRLTRWRCLMIDPLLYKRWRGIPSTLPSLICDYGLPMSFNGDKVVLLSINAHVDLNWYHHQFLAPQMLTVAIPCHVQQVIANHEPTASYIDYGIAAGRNEVLVWTR